MSHTRLLVAASIIALFILGGFLLSVPRTPDVAMTEIAATAPSIPLVTLRDSFKKDVHTITGSLEAPNACAAVSATGTTTDQGIHVAISMNSDTGVCLEVPTRMTFSITVIAPPNVPITATVNGSVATTTAS